MKRLVLILLILFSTSISHAALWDNNEGRWKLSDNAGDGTWYDETANDNDLTGANTPTGATDVNSIANGAAHVTMANSEHISITDGSQTGLDVSSAFTVAARFKITSTTFGGYHIIASKQGSSSQRCYSLFVQNSLGTATLYAQASLNGSALTTITGGTTLSVDTWYSVFYIYDGSDLYLYLDNSSDATPVALSGSINNSTGNFSIGSQYNGTNSFFNGDIDDVAVWSRAITSGDRTEYEALYSDFAAVSIAVTSPTQYQIYQRDGSDEADIPITGTYGGTPTAIEASFNGGSYVTIDDSPSAGTFDASLTGQAAGQGTLSVRFTNLPGVIDTVADVGIGEVFIIAGQSNAEGRLTNDQTYTDDLTAVLWEEGASAWIELADPSDADSSDGSAWPLLADMIMDAESVPVGFVTTADGGTALYLGPWASGGASYVDSVGEVTGSGTTDARCILWWQGESDAIANVTEANYQAALSTFIDDYQTSISIAGIDLMPASLGMIAGAYSPGTLNSIRSAIQNRWDNDSDIIPGPVFCDTDLTGGDSIHFKTDAEGELVAQRFYHFLKHNYPSVFGSPSGGRGPRVLAALLTDTDEITVAFTVAVSPLQGESTTGWAVTDDSGANAVTGVTISGNTNAVLSLTRTVDGDATVTWGGVNTAIGSLFRDSSTTPHLGGSNTGLPPEPFIDQAVSTDLIDPVCTITTPTSDATYSAGWAISGATLSNDGNVGTLNLGGTSSDEGGVTSITWVCPESTPSSGTASGTTTWTITGVTLAEGSNVFTVTANDAAMNTGTDIITVTYDSTVSYALPGTIGLADVGQFCYQVLSRDSGSGKVFVSGFCPLTQLVNRVGSFCSDLEIIDVGEDLNFTTDSTNGWSGSINLNAVFLNRKQDN